MAEESERFDPDGLASDDAEAFAADGLKAGDIRVGVSGRLLVAPLGTAGPADVTAEWPAAWKDLGYLTEDGVAQTPSTDSEDIMAWQSMDPVRNIVTRRSLEWKFTVLQRSPEAIRLAFGGGTITEIASNTPKQWKYTPPKAGETNERAFGLEVKDGTVTDRYVLNRGTVSDVGDIIARRNEGTAYELTVKALAPQGGGSVWELLSNDPALAPTGTPPVKKVTVTNMTPKTGKADGSIDVTVTGTNLDVVTAVDMKPKTSGSPTTISTFATKTATSLKFKVPSGPAEGDHEVMLKAPGAADVKAGEFKVTS